MIVLGKYMNDLFEAAAPSKPHLCHSRPIPTHKLLKTDFQNFAEHNFVE